MTACTLADVDAALCILRAAYPGMNPEVDGTTAGTWHYGVGRFTAPVVASAAHRWAESEPRFPALTEFIAACHNAARRLATDEENTGVRGSTRCPECDGTTFVPVDDAGRGAVRPCGRCNPAGARRYTEGHYERGHDCQVCRDLVRAKVTR